MSDFARHFHVHKSLGLRLSMIFNISKKMRSTRCSSQTNLSQIDIYSAIMIGESQTPQLVEFIRLNLKVAYSMGQPKKFWKSLHIVMDQLQESEIANAELQIKAEIIQKLREKLAQKRPSMMNEFKVGEHLGKASYGNVFAALHIATSINVAIKEIDIQTMEYDLRRQPEGYATKRLKSEIEIGSLRHHHLVQCYGSFSALKREYLVMEKMVGSLDKVMEKMGNNRVPKHVASKILHDVCQGIAFLHQNDIIHRDIKPQNIFLQEDGVFKIGDFGLAVNVHDSKHTTCGTVLYMSPEVLNKQKYSKPIDIWALGILAYELLISDKPFTSTMEVYKIIMNQSTSRSTQADVQELNHLQQDIFEFLSNTLRQDPHQRWTATQLLSSELIADRSRKPFFLSA